MKMDVKQNENADSSSLPKESRGEPAEQSPAGQSTAAGSKHRTGFRALWIIGIIILVGLAVYFVAILPRVETNQELAAVAATAGKKTVIVVTPTEGASEPEITLPGNIEANQMASIYSRVDGYLKRWYVDIGDHVQEGQVLADVEAPQIDASLRMAQAQLELADANLRLAQTNSARSRELFQNRVNSQQELDTVLANEQVQEATRDNAAASLTSAQDLKDFEQIRAPFAGTITARYVDIGSLVTSGSGRTVQKLFDLAQSDPVRVFVNVPQTSVNYLKPGGSATVTVAEFPGQNFPGKITRNAGALDLASRTLLLEIEVPNSDRRLYSGMYARVQFTLQNPTPTLLLPDTAIQIDAKGIRVFVVDSSGKIQVRPITLGRDFGTKSEILTGITATDRVVRNPTEGLHEGMVVNVQPPAE